MPHRRERTRDQIEQDFLDAIERLKNGQPQHPELRERAKKGKPIKINIATVAKEANRARGLIGIENCRYPEVRQLVLIEAGASGIVPQNRDDVIKRLRAEIAELRVQLSQAEAHAAYHFAQRTKAEKSRDDYKSRYERLKKNIINERHKGEVINLFSKNIDG